MKRCEKEKDSYAFIYITIVIGAIIGGVLAFFMHSETNTAADIIWTILICICGIIFGAIFALIMLYWVVAAIDETKRNREEKRRKKLYR